MSNLLPSAKEAFLSGCKAAHAQMQLNELVFCPFEQSDSFHSPYKNWHDGWNATMETYKPYEDEECPVPAASQEGKSSSAIGNQWQIGQSEWDDLIQRQKRLERQLDELTKGIQFLAEQVKTMVDALAEEVDPDLPVTSYLSGKPV